MFTIESNKNAFSYIAATMIWTWSVLSIPALMGLGFEDVITKIAYVLAGAAPSLIAFIFVFCSGDRLYIYSFLKRIISLQCMDVKGLIVIFLLIPTVAVLSILSSSALSSAKLDWSVIEAYLKNPLGFAAFAMYTLVFGPLAEEIGWRGFLLDSVKEKGPLVYGVGIGLIWTLWHLPMFFISGTYQNSILHQGFLPVFCFALSTIALGVIIGELAKQYNSILAAILFHFMVNFTGELVPLDIVGEIVQTAIYGMIVCGTICRFYCKRKVR